MSAFLNKTTARIDSFLESAFANKYVSTTVITLLVVYAALAAPTLPPAVARLFDNVLFKILVMVAILVLLKYSPVVALLAAIGFVLSLQALNHYKLLNFANVFGATAPKEVVSEEGDRTQLAPEESGVPVGFVSPYLYDNSAPIDLSTEGEAVQEAPQCEKLGPGDENSSPVGFSGVQIGAEYSGCGSEL